MAMADRGFASMDEDKKREISSKGGKTAHQKGAAHEFSPDEARYAAWEGLVKRYTKIGDPKKLREVKRKIAEWKRAQRLLRKGARHG